MPSTESAPTSPERASRPLAPIRQADACIGDSPRPLDHEPGPVCPRRARMRYQSPLRYPGAKSRLAKPLVRLLEHAQRSSAMRPTELLVEPFTGGASVSLRLVGAGAVERVLLADADPLVAQFWQIAAADTEALIARMHEEPVTLERWDHWRAWTPPSGMGPSTARFESAVKCLFLNRTTFSGILHGRAGPIGGRAQDSDYGIGCRFNKDAIADRLRYVGELYDAHRIVDVWCKDWRDTLTDTASRYKTLVPDEVVAYLDPPYLRKSRKLYQRSFDPNGGYAGPDPDALAWADDRSHCDLAEYLRSEMAYRWILSYDHHPALLRDPGLYAAKRMTPSRADREDLGIRCWRISRRLVTLTYTASSDAGRGHADELLLTTLPPGSVLTDDTFRSCRFGSCSGRLKSPAKAWRRRR